MLFFAGRLGEMIKTGGANVTPSEVEAALDTLPEVELGLVVGVPDATLGQRVAAAVVLAPVLAPPPEPVLAAEAAPEVAPFCPEVHSPKVEVGAVPDPGVVVTYRTVPVPVGLSRRLWP